MVNSCEKVNIINIVRVFLPVNFSYCADLWGCAEVTKSKDSLKKKLADREKEEMKNKMKIKNVLFQEFLGNRAGI